MEFFKTLDWKVYPSDECTISVKLDDTYGGAHEYWCKPTLGYNEGKTEYIDDEIRIRFVQKFDNGDILPGLQSEQLAYILLDRLEKLNAVYPHDQYEPMKTGLEMFLTACKRRIDDRVSRGVMGELKK